MTDDNAGCDAAARTRLDKWLWYARFFKTRSLAARQISGGHVRLNAARVDKPARTVSVGDVLTFAQADRVRVIKVLAHGTRRGPAPEAALLYEDLTPPADGSAPSAERVGARPTKKDRRAMDALRRD
ncbi:MAG: RNA-binding S4 domain-containing protein [Rhodobacteraceae bacterium]|nr:RNA-binding S4 domain-containing protein [Paracoccaceae bacterium]